MKESDRRAVRQEVWKVFIRIGAVGLFWLIASTLLHEGMIWGHAILMGALLTLMAAAFCALFWLTFQDYNKL